MFSFEKARSMAVSTLTAVSSIGTRALIASDSPTNHMNGLHNFIMRIRLCQSREDEDKNVNQELAKIRSIFNKPVVDGYTKKKSICKLLYVFLLGRQVSFGQSEALSLLSSNVFSEKQMGYLFISILFNPKSNTNALLIQCIRSDLLSDNPKFAYLAVQCVANIGNNEMGLALSGTIFELIKQKKIPDFVMQSALLCVVKLIRTSETPSTYSEWSKDVLAMLNDHNLGVVLNAISLLDELMRTHADLMAEKADIFRIVVTELRRILSGIRPGLHDYQYGNLPAPWHLVSLMRLLRHFDIPEDSYSKHLLEEVIKTILDKVEEPVDSGKIRKDVKCTNVRYAVFFEAVGVVTQNTNSPDIWTRAQLFAGWLLSHKINNFRYLALEALGLLASAKVGLKPSESFQKRAVVYLKKESDPSIQQRAVTFLCSICDHTNVTIIVEELLDYLRNSEATNRKAVAVQIAVIAERLLPNYDQYVRCLIKLVTVAGDVIDDKICSRIVQIVTSKVEVQQLAAEVSLRAIMDPFPNEKLLIVASFILGEFGHLTTESEAILQFHVLRSKYTACSGDTKAVVLSSVLKMAHKRPALRKLVCDFFRENATSCDLEVQKRSVEYLNLLELTNNGVLSAVLGALPPTDGMQRIAGDCSSSTLDNQQPSATVAGLMKGDARSCANEPPMIFIQVPADFAPFVSTCEGLLYDDVILKITMRSSYQGATAHMTVTFESKFLSVPSFSHCKLLNDQHPNLSVKVHQKSHRKSKRIDQDFSFECHHVFEQCPKVYVEVSVDNALRIKILLNLPLFVNKFFEPVPMTERVFFERWQILEAQSTPIDRFFRSKKPCDVSATKLLLKDLNLSLLELGCSTSNTVFGCGGLFRTTVSTIGCLVRLETDLAVHSYRMSIRSPDAHLSKQVAELLQYVL